MKTGVNRGHAGSRSSLISQGHPGAGQSAYLGLVASSATGGRESKRVGSRGEREMVGIQKRKEEVWGGEAGGWQRETQREMEGGPERR